MRPIRPLVFIAVLTALPPTPGAFAMGNTPSPSSSVTAACVATSSKSVLPAGVCDAFVKALGAAGMKSVVVPVGQPSDVTLVVSDASASLLSARIDRGPVKGVELATIRRGASLDKAAFTVFLTKLIAATRSLQ